MTQSINRMAWPLAVPLIAGLLSMVATITGYGIEGRQFVLSLGQQPLNRILLNQHNMSDGETPLLILMMTPATKYSVNVSISIPVSPSVETIKKLITPAQMTTVGIPSTWAPSLDGAGILVSATHEIFLYQSNNTDSCSSYYTPILPVAYLGTSYVLSSVKLHRASLHRLSLAIISLAQGTIVNISKPLSAPLHVFNSHNENQMSHASDVMQTNLSAFHAAIYQSNFDLNGYRIYSNAPVAVLLNIHSSRRQLGQSGLNGYHLLQQQIPVDQWGTEYIDVIPTKPGYTTSFRITGHKLGTKLIYHTALGRGTIKMMHDTQCNIPVRAQDEYVSISSTEPISVMRVSATVCHLQTPISCCDSWDTSMIPAVSNWRNRYYLPPVSDGNIFYSIIISKVLWRGISIDGVGILEHYNGSVECKRLEYNGCLYCIIFMQLDHSVQMINHMENRTFYLSSTKWNQWGNKSPPDNECVPAASTDETNEGSVHTESPSESSNRNRFKVYKSPPHSVLYNVKPLGSNANSRVINFEKSPSSIDVGETSSSASPVVGVVATLSVAIFCVLACIVGFVIAEFWSRRTKLGRVRISPLLNPE